MKILDGETFSDTDDFGETVYVVTLECGCRMPIPEAYIGLLFEDSVPCVHCEPEKVG